MKNITFAFLLLISSVISAQINGNVSSISRQNVVHMENNSIIYRDQINQFRRQNLVPNPIITLDVKALHNIIADSYTAVFNITQIGKTSEETNRLMKNRMAKVKSELLANGIPEQDIILDVVSFIPIYETVVEHKIFSKKYNEVPKGFELQQNIHVKFTKVNQFEKILSACANNEIYNLVKVDYFIDNIQEIYSQLRVEILKTLKEKQQFYTDLGFDITLYKPTIADTQYCYFPKEFYKEYQAFNSTSIEAFSKKQGVQKTTKPISYYYDPLSFKDYDIVINSSIVEPVIQIGLEIKLQYTSKPQEPKSADKETVAPKYFLISPNGTIDVKELKIS
ncbi:SIMPL domain-containing protein [Aquimarina sp. I32.4]|uniref:SIMPL domain-containing protein n=1 Tax=Aquimarina sp. I32.4 TaxID=2053903 RepID=UPI000CDEF171|nr:SIMPL domain-containing protein [Aquimarina sp. I32.4]